ncbi:uncharacterized protein LOC123922065 [Trifolium pratense]|uniref:uncharacterized protein LOC123922065 n=1 Tax=Trifolium pratense TaxID=57577 RepID=UPI001E692BE0|nr:uncharacterized protein LOC123922065 [Trifolium pratense]
MDLTFINLSHSQSITQIPDLSGAKNLRVLAVDKCHKLVRFDISIGFMPNLVYLSASGCNELKGFVPKMYLSSLQVLSFNYCKKFEHFPHVMKKMDTPLKIHMINTAIKKFPNSIGNLTGLEFIDMSFCKGLKDLSNNFLLLPKLITMKIDGCSQIGESFQRLKECHSVANSYSNLETLQFSEANLSYEDVNAIIEKFPKLKDLKVSHNGFVALPECIKGSVHLKSLDVSFCMNLTGIPELPFSIHKIDATHCPSLTLEASRVLWSKVSQEIQRTKVVMPMPKREILEWFDCASTQEIPVLWARRKFPVFALALVLKQDHEDSAEDVIQVVEMIKENFLEHFIDLSPEDLQIASLAAERILRAQVELMEENSLDIGMPIILEYTYAPGATHRRFYKPVFKRQNQLSFELGISDLRVIIVELKCQTAGEEEAPSSSLEESLEDVNYDPELEELLTMIEQDAMRFNKSCGKMKASIVKTVEPISESYLLETLICMRLMTSGNLTMFGSATKFKITPYGKMRAEDEPFRIPSKCFWGLCYALIALIIWLFYFILCVCPYFDRIPIIRKLLVWGWWLVKQMFLSCKKLCRGFGTISKRVKEKEL